MSYHSDSVAELLGILRQGHKRWQLHEDLQTDIALELLDDATHSLISEGIYLCKEVSDYHFIQADFSHTLDQKNKIRFASDINETAIAERIAEIVSVRLLEPVQTLEYQQVNLVWRDDEHKAVVKAQLWLHGDQALLQVQGIKGYAKAYQWLTTLLSAPKSAHKVYKQSCWQWLLAANDYSGSVFSQIQTAKIDADMPARQAIFAMISPMLAKAQLNEDGIKYKSEDIEFLHEYRVSLRKARSLLSLFKDIFPATTLFELKQQMGELGRRTNLLRDLDVYLLEQDNYLALLPQGLRDGLPLMFADFARNHKQAKTSTKRWLSSQAYSNSMQHLQAVFAEPDKMEATMTSDLPIQPVVSKKILKRYRKIAKLGKAITPDTPDEEVHELRIECKKFRYLLEFFTDLYPKTEIKALIKRLKKLQDVLGKFNDYSVQQVSLQEYLHEKTRAPEVSVSVGALMAVLAQMQLAQRQQVEARFAAFADLDTEALVSRLFVQPEIA